MYIIMAFTIIPTAILLDTVVKGPVDPVPQYILEFCKFESPFNAINTRS